MELFLIYLGHLLRGGRNYYPCYLHAVCNLFSA